jgi:hypothetical protein
LQLPQLLAFLKLALNPEEWVSVSQNDHDIMAKHLTLTWRIPGGLARLRVDAKWRKGPICHTRGPPPDKLEFLPPPAAKIRGFRLIFDVFLLIFECFWMPNLIFFEFRTNSKILVPNFGNQK